MPNKPGGERSSMLTKTVAATMTLMFAAALAFIAAQYAINARQQISAMQIQTVAIQELAAVGVERLEALKEIRERLRENSASLERMERRLGLRTGTGSDNTGDLPNR